MTAPKSLPVDLIDKNGVLEQCTKALVTYRINR